jgi:hypothetical protein
MGFFLLSFFSTSDKAPNISNSTKAALSDAVAACSNALVHLDEYKNNIEVEKREFIKGLWDGVGRSRLNMDKDKKRETTKVNSGIIISGQEMPTVDIAIFSRMIYLTFNKSVFSAEEKRRFTELSQMRVQGLSHLVLEILKYRTKVETTFHENYRMVMRELNTILGDMEIEDRIQGNWAIPLAMYRTLQTDLKLPMTYEDMFLVTVEGIKRQNGECKSSNELANFWNVVAYLLQEGEIYNEGDFRIEYLKTFKSNIVKSDIIWPRPRPVLMMRRNRVMMLYKKFSKQVGDSALPIESLKFYLENSKEYLGVKNSVRFKNIMKGMEMTKVVPISGGQTAVKHTATVEQAMCFDYEQLKQSYGINLEIDADESRRYSEDENEVKAYKY